MRTLASANAARERVFVCAHALGSAVFISYRLKRLSLDSALSSILSYKGWPFTASHNYLSLTPSNL